MPKVDYLNFIEGLYSDTPPHLIPDNALASMSNVVTSYKLGAILKRPGYSIVDATVESGKSIGGLFDFRQNPSTQKVLATVDDATSDDTQLFYKTLAGSWTEVTAAETAWANVAGTNVEMESFLGYAFIVGHSSTDGFLPIATLTGTTFSTSAQLTNAPQAKFVKRYRDRIYMANVKYGGTEYPYRVRFSTVPTAGSLGDWDFTDNFIDIDYSEEITGVGSNWDRFLMFTQFDVYYYDQTQKKHMSAQGCSNHRTIKNSGTYTFWANSDGVWRSQGGSAVNVSGRVIDFVRYGNSEDFFAEVVDEEYHLYVGDVRVNGVDYANCTVILNIPSMTWRVHEYKDDMSIFASIRDAGRNRLYMGDATGDVHNLGKYTDSTLVNTDNTSPIHSWFQTKAFHFGSPSDTKSIESVTSYAERAQSLNLKGRILDRDSQALTEFVKIGQLESYVNLSMDMHDLSGGNFIQFEGTEMSSNEYWSFFGLTVDAELEAVIE